jgi:hypothetical protein
LTAFGVGQLGLQYVSRDPETLTRNCAQRSAQSVRRLDTLQSCISQRLAQGIAREVFIALSGQRRKYETAAVSKRAQLLQQPHHLSGQWHHVLTPGFHHVRRQRPFGRPDIYLAPLHGNDIARALTEITAKLQRRTGDGIGQTADRTQYFAQYCRHRGRSHMAPLMSWQVVAQVKVEQAAFLAQPLRDRQPDNVSRRLRSDTGELGTVLIRRLDCRQHVRCSDRCDAKLADDR